MPARPQRQASSKTGNRTAARPVAKASVRPNAQPSAPRGGGIATSLPSAEQLGSSAVEMVQKIRGWSGNAGKGLVAACRLWWFETRRGLRDLIDLESLKLGTDESRHVEKAARPARVEASKHVARPARQPRSTTGKSPWSRIVPLMTQSRKEARSDDGIALVENGGASREHLLEVSVLESLGFFDPANEVVVTLGQMETLAQMDTPASPTPSQIQPELQARSGVRQLIPDIDLKGWKPHVIARSKLGKGRFSTAMIAGLAISLLVMAVIVTNLLRAPGEEAARQEDALTAASGQLAIALSGLEPVLADVSTDVAEATSNLISVDSAARDLFDAAAMLGEGSEDAVLRQSAASLAQRSLALESLVGDSLRYRVVLNPLWNSPDLVGVSDSTQAAAAVVTWQASLEDMVESLPSSSDLAVHVGQVREFVQGIESWKVRYLDALALGDLAGAEAAVADLDGQLSLLAQSGEDILSGVFSDASTERGRILSDLTSLSGTSGIAGIIGISG